MYVFILNKTWISLMVLCWASIYVLICLCAIKWSSLVKCLVRIFAHLFHLGILSSHKIIGALYLLWIKPILRYCFANIFCHFVIFSSLTVSFEKQNLKFVSSPIYQCLFPLLFAYMCPARNFLAILSHWIFSYKFYSYIYYT